MNYKKLKRVFALGMAVLLSVSTSVYGGTMEVHAAEVISDNLLENEVTDNLSLNEIQKIRATTRTMRRMQSREIARIAPRMLAREMRREIPMTTSRMQNREMCRAIPMAMFRM